MVPRRKRGRGGASLENLISGLEGKEEKGGARSPKEEVTRRDTG